MQVPGRPRSVEECPPIANAVRDAMLMIRSGAPRTRLRARLRDIRVPVDRGVLTLAPAHAALLADQLPKWMGQGADAERAGNAIALFLDWKPAP